MFIDLAKQRFSCRDYSTKEIENEKIKQVLEHARIAASACNLQPWFFYVVKSKEALEKTHKTYSREWFTKAPVVIIACANTANAWIRKNDKKNHAEIDLSIAIDHITLAATDLGLATCWICAFDSEMTRELFSIPQNLEPVALIPLGYSNVEPNINRFEKERKKLDEIYTVL